MWEVDLINGTREGFQCANHACHGFEFTLAFVDVLSDVFDGFVGLKRELYLHILLCWDIVYFEYVIVVRVI